jgi:hypothetical protein
VQRASSQNAKGIEAVNIIQKEEKKALEARQN